jgi:hypothetical protein
MIILACKSEQGKAGVSKVFKSFYDFKHLQGPSTIWLGLFFKFYFISWYSPPDPVTFCVSLNLTNYPNIC